MKSDTTDYANPDNFQKLLGKCTHKKCHQNQMIKWICVSWVARAIIFSTCFDLYILPIKKRWTSSLKLAKGMTQGSSWRVRQWSPRSNSTEQRENGVQHGWRYWWRLKATWCWPWGYIFCYIGKTYIYIYMFFFLNKNIYIYTLHVEDFNNICDNFVNIYP